LINRRSHITREKHTGSTLLHLLRRNREDVQDFDHDLHDYVSHRLSWWHFHVRFEAFEEIFDTLEEIDKGLLTRVNILGGLIDIPVENPSTKESRKMLTKKRTPTPAEITFAGENTCEADMRKQVVD